MKKTITVQDLINQLTTLAENGYANAPVIYLDENDMSHEFDNGVHDIYDATTVVLG